MNSIMPRAENVITRSIVLCTALLLASIIACTDNPFESRSTMQPTVRRISGFVQLGERSDHSGVHVWLDGFDISSVTDTDGAFAITLPPPSLQATPGGVNGVFSLYAYLGNYRIDSVSVAVRNGMLLLPSESIDEAGRLRDVLFMRELFSVETVLSESTIRSSAVNFITAHVKLRSISQPISVYFPRAVDAVRGPIVLHELQTGAATVMSTEVSGVGTADIVQLGPVEFVRSLLLILPASSLRPGRYEIIPYILPRQQSVPSSLLAGIGLHVRALSPDYVFFPMLRRGGILTVTE